MIEQGKSLNRVWVWAALIAFLAIVAVLWITALVIFFQLVT